MILNGTFNLVYKFCFGICLYLYANMITKKYFYMLNEEKELLELYKREKILYDNIKLFNNFSLI